MGGVTFELKELLFGKNRSNRLKSIQMGGHTFDLKEFLFGNSNSFEAIQTNKHLTVRMGRVTFELK